MSTEVGTYTVEDAFHITGRGWVLVGTLMGVVNSGHHLAFPSGLVVRTTGIELIRVIPRNDKIHLRIQAEFALKQALIDQQIIGATARVLE